MAFKPFKFTESEAEEAARLALSPEGSINHCMSKLPVQIHGWIEDLMIEMPHSAGFDRHTVIVVPFRYHRYQRDESLPRRAHDGSWDVIVVASNHPSYPVGGHRLSIPEMQLVRGTQRTFDVPALVPAVV
jgi:hypothetical protein